MQTQPSPGSTQRQPLTATIEASPAYEFLLTLHAITCAGDYEAYAVGRAWFDAVRAQAGPELLAAVEQFCVGCDTVWDQLLGLASNCPSPRDVPAFIAHLEATEPAEIRLHLLGYYHRAYRRTTPPDIILQAAAGQPEAQQRFLRAASFTDDIPWQAALRRFLTRDAATVKTDLLAILKRWYKEIFREQEPQLMPMLVRDAAAKRALARTMAPERLIAIAANGYEYVPEPDILRVLLIPTFIGRPWLIGASLLDTRILCYPVAAENLTPESDAPPSHLVQLCQALADERRLRILKWLTTGSYTLQEIADHFGVAKTTMLHHLVILRAAGLVRIRSSDKRYRLCRDAIAAISPLLDTYLNMSLGARASRPPVTREQDARAPRTGQPLT
jgi:DNA-binding transcriptional ArsR family regulator